MEVDKVLIGSARLSMYFSDYPKIPKDADYAVERTGMYKSSKQQEYLVIPALVDHVNTFGMSPDVLYTLKCSHIFWNINWDKHMFDIVFLQDKGAKLIPALFDKLFTFHKELHGDLYRSKLDVSAKEFFDNALETKVDHDYLHTLLKTPPTYTKVLCDGAEVEVCEEKFNQLTFEEKCDLVREEVYVMAWERLPNEKFYHAYSKMLKKFIMIHAPLWEVFFILENYKLLCKPPKFDFITFFNSKVNEH